MDRAYRPRARHLPADAGRRQRDRLPAAGDCAEAFDKVSGTTVVSAIQPNAAEQARVAALHMVGQPAELKVGITRQGEYTAPTASLVQYHEGERWSANYTVSANRWAGPDHSETELDHAESGNDFVRRRVSDSHYERQGLNASARLQFKGDPGESLTLMPFMAFSHGVSPGQLALTQTGGTNAGSGETSTYNDNRFAIARVNGQWRRKLSADSNLEWKFNAGGWNKIGRAHV